MPTKDHRLGAPAEPEIEVTPEMIEAAAEEIFGWLPNDAMPGSENDRRSLAEDVLRAGLAKIDRVKLREWALNFKK
jgi:hypothetical protein